MALTASFANANPFSSLNFMGTHEVSLTHITHSSFPILSFAGGRGGGYGDRGGGGYDRGEMSEYGICVEVIYGFFLTFIVLFTRWWVRQRWLQ